MSDGLGHPLSLPVATPRWSLEPQQGAEARGVGSMSAQGPTQAGGGPWRKRGRRGRAAAGAWVTHILGRCLVPTLREVLPSHPQHVRPPPCPRVSPGPLPSRHLQPLPCCVCPRRGCPRYPRHSRMSLCPALGSGKLLHRQHPQREERVWCVVGHALWWGQLEEPALAGGLGSSQGPVGKGSP